MPRRCGAAFARRSTGAGNRRVIDDRKRAAGFQHRVHFGEQRLRVHRPVVGLEVQVVIAHRHQHQIDRCGRNAELTDFGVEFHDVLQPAAFDALRQRVADERLIRGVVVHVDLAAAAAADDPADHFAVIAAAGEQVDHGHAGRDAEELQHFDRVIALVARAIRLGARRIAHSDADRIVSSGRAERRREHRNHQHHRASCGTHHVCYSSNCTTILPTFSPVKSPMNAAGARSMPFIRVSRY